MVYVHLRSRQEHGEKCAADKCATGCGFLALEAWLAGPLTAWDAVRDERLREREKALLAGDI